MRTLIALLLALVAVAARADLYAFGKLSLARGYQGPVVFDLSWSPGVQRLAAGVTATLVVYERAPVGGAGGVVRFVEPLVPAGDPSPSNEMVAFVSTTDTSRPGTYYAEIVVVEGSTVDVLHGTVVLEGR